MLLLFLPVLLLPVSPCCSWIHQCYSWCSVQVAPESISATPDVLSRLLLNTPVLLLMFCPGCSWIYPCYFSFSSHKQKLLNLSATPAVLSMLILELPVCYSCCSVHFDPWATCATHAGLSMLYLNLSSYSGWSFFVVLKFTCATVLFCLFLRN